MCRMQFAGCDKGILGGKARNGPSKLGCVRKAYYIETAWERVNWCVRKAGYKKNARNGPFGKKLIKRQKTA